MNDIKPIEPIYPTFFNTQLQKKVDEKKKNKKDEEKPEKSFIDCLKELYNEKR